MLLSSGCGHLGRRTTAMLRGPYNSRIDRNIHAMMTKLPAGLCPNRLFLDWSFEKKVLF